MGAPEKAIPNADGPVGQFAQRLRDRRVRAGTPSYRMMANRCHYSHSVLAEAAAGYLLPSWEVTEQYLTACWAEHHEVASWEKYWEETLQLVKNLVAAEKLAVQVSLQESVVAERARPAAPAVPTVTEQPLADPTQVRTFDDLTYHLTLLRLQAGNIALRELAWRSRWSVGTLSGVFSGKRKPRLQSLLHIVSALYHYTVGEEIPGDLRGQWRDAWGRAHFNHTRPDLRRRAHQDRVLRAEDQPASPVGAIIAQLPAHEAATMLHQLDERTAAGILRTMPTRRAAAIIEQLALMSTITPVAPLSLISDTSTPPAS